MEISAPRVRLLEVDPDLGRFLSGEELDEARRLAIPVLTFGRDHNDSLEVGLREHRAFAAVVLDGLVFQQMQVGDQVGMLLLGPGDVVSSGTEEQSLLINETSTRVAAGTRLALLGVELLLAAGRWPGLIRGLHLRSVQQAERQTIQLVICQLPRVDQRILALMWLLAESWGRVTSAGTTLPLKLTHDTLGALVGARRPTVTLALRDLSERGAIVRQDPGWLLLEAPPGASVPAEKPRSPALISEPRSQWSDHPPAPTPTPDIDTWSALKARLQELRTQHESGRRKFEERLREMARVRERCRENRTLLASNGLSRRSRSS